YSRKPPAAPSRRAQPDAEGQKRQILLPQPIKKPGLVPGFLLKHGRDKARLRFTTRENARTHNEATQTLKPEPATQPAERN
ncbi:MAG: hypothetical protein AAGA50_29175, partial [Pseudomonadota bacterium]